MNRFITPVFCSVLISLSFACKKRESFPVQPIITQVNVTLNNDLTGTLFIAFTDGDGDLGLNMTTDTLGNFHPDSIYGKNLLLGYFERENGVWIRNLTVEESFKFRIERLEIRGESKTLQGTISVDLPIAYDFSSANDTIRYSAILVDRALHQSEEVFSPILLKP